MESWDRKGGIGTEIVETVGNRNKHVIEITSLLQTMHIYHKWERGQTHGIEQK